MFTSPAANTRASTKPLMDQPQRVDMSSQKRLTPQENTAIAKAADLNTIARITQIWADRLQLISVYASFFTSIDSLLFTLASNKGNDSTTSRLMQASLTGALVFHAAAAILAYIAAFILIRYRLNDAESVPSDPKAAIKTVYATYAPSERVGPSVDQRGKLKALESGSNTKVGVGRGHHSHTLSSPFSPVAPLFSTLSSMVTSLLDHPPLLDIDLRRVSFLDFRAIFPCVRDAVLDPVADAEKNAVALVRLLNRCHHVCSMFALAGFVLVVTGIVTYIWAVLERSIAIFGSACVGVCIFFGVAALV